MTYAKRVDITHGLVVKTLRDLGCTVFDTSRVAGGFPDLVVGINGKTVLVEVKRDASAPYTQSQLAFMQKWQGSAVSRIHDVEGCKNLVNLLKNS